MIDKIRFLPGKELIKEYKINSKNIFFDIDMSPLEERKYQDSQDFLQWNGYRSWNAPDLLYFVDRLNLYISQFESVHDYNIVVYSVFAFWHFYIEMESPEKYYKCIHNEACFHMYNHLLYAVLLKNQDEKKQHIMVQSKMAPLPYLLPGIYSVFSLDDLSSDSNFLKIVNVFDIPTLSMISETMVRINSTLLRLRKEQIFALPHDESFSIKS